MQGFAGAGNHLQSQRVFPRCTIFDGARTGRVIRQVATYGAYCSAGRVRRPEEAFCGGGLLHGFIAYTRFYHHQPVVAVKFDYTVHTLHGEDQ